MAEETRRDMRAGKERIVHTYSDEEKAAALELYVKEGLGTAHRETGIPRTTLRQWARRAGLDTHEIARHYLTQTSAAVEATIAYREDLREEVRTMLLEGTHGTLQRLLESEPSSKDCQPLATTAAILIDKYRLEMGEATGREERGSIGDARTKAAAILDELGAKRAERKEGAA